MQKKDEPTYCVQCCDPGKFIDLIIQCNPGTRHFFFGGTIKKLLKNGHFYNKKVQILIKLNTK